ncbi:hypothetical protein [Amycolatopsis dendrobii]|uniref:Uncharacterized protein n=1 Tax=Amycolatopsis dendrobii TaxID=2760662 RepID=A0A7W3VSZ7_9PSEU|nr:hypothetical protein [Amycolatopsis dendrobii]MBB1152491.1 hypothetical protein [Amycolatopsis dendrobii]
MAYSFTFHNVPALTRYGFKNDGMNAPPDWVYNEDVVLDMGITVSIAEVIAQPVTPTGDLQV